MSNIINSDDDSEGKPTVWASEARPLLVDSDAQCMSTAFLKMIESSVFNTVTLRLILILIFMRIKLWRESVIKLVWKGNY